MAAETRRLCDRCGQPFKAGAHYSPRRIGRPMRQWSPRFDLCQPCVLALREWLNGDGLAGVEADVR